MVTTLKAHRKTTDNVTEEIASAKETVKTVETAVEDAKQDVNLAQEQKAHAKHTAELVQKAIKLSHDSAPTFAAAAAAVVYHAAKYGQIAPINDLFVGLHSTVAFAFRAYFMAKVNDIFAQDGVKEKREVKGEMVDVWVERPTPIFTYQADPKTDNKRTNNHFTFNKAEAGERGARTKAAVVKAKAAIIEYGEEELAKIQWISATQVKTDRVEQPDSKWFDRMGKMLIDRAGTPSSKIAKSDLIAAARVLNLGKQVEAAIENSFNTAHIEKTANTNSELIKSEENTEGEAKAA